MATPKRIDTREDKRLTIRVPPEEFDQMDDLRHSLSLTWQGLLLDHMREWASTAGSPSRGVTQAEAIAGRLGVEMMRAGEAWPVLAILEHWRKTRRKGS